MIEYVNVPNIVQAYEAQLIDHEEARSAIFVLLNKQSQEANKEDK